MPSLDSHPTMPSPIRSISFPADGPSPRNLRTFQPIDGYFGQNHHQSPTRPSHLRSNLRVRFDHLLASESPPSEDIHPNEMYSRDRVTTPHPAQRILHRTTPPSRTSSWSDTSSGTPNLLGAKSPPTTATSAEVIGSIEQRRISETLYGPATRFSRRELIALERDADGDVEMNENIEALTEVDASCDASSIFARHPTIRGNSWVFDEAERLSMERARGLRIVEIPSAYEPRSIEEQFKGKRNGSERSLRSLLSLNVSSPTEENGGGVDEENLLLSPPAKHPDRGKNFVLFDRRLNHLNRAMVLRTHSSTS